MFKEALFTVSPLRMIEPVDTPAGRTFVRVLTVHEKDEYDQAVSKEGGFRARLVIACCCTEAGEPEFDDFDFGPIDRLPLTVVEPIVDAAMRLNRLRNEDVDAARKNSSPGRNGNSSSG